MAGPDEDAHVVDLKLTRERSKPPSAWSIANHSNRPVLMGDIAIRTLLHGGPPVLGVEPDVVRWDER